MSEDLIKAEARTEFGKGAARRIRRASKVPAVIYGHGNDPKHVTLPGHDTMMALKHGGSNALLRIDVEGKTLLALTKQIQADPIKGFLEHIDFVEVRKGEKVTVEIPIHVIGESKSEAMTVTELNTVSVEAEATNIPEYIEVSVEDAEVGFQVFAKDLDLPTGSTLLTDEEYLVVNVVHAPTAEEIEAELDEAEADAGIEHDLSDAEIAAPPRPRLPSPRTARSPRARLPGVAPSPRATRADLGPRCPTLSPGWSSGWATPVRRTPARATTWATSSPTSWRGASVGPGASTRPVAPTSSRGGSGHPAQMRRGWCSAVRAAT